MTWIDISVPLHNTMVHWPGDPPFNRKPIKDMEQGSTANLSNLTMGSHTGTHVDAPKHFIQNGQTIDNMPLDIMTGIARVIEIADRHSIKLEEIEKHKIHRGERILFKTYNSLSVWNTDIFVEDFIYISNEVADLLADKKVKMVGVDYLSVGGYKGNGSYVHHKLLGSGIWLIETLNLSKVNAGKYYLICLPLRIEGGDGAPARAILRPV
jgi:arylformamidase